MPGFEISGAIWIRMRRTARRSSSAVRPKVLRARSLPSSRPFQVAVFFSALHFLGLIATVTALVLLFQEPSQLAMKVMLSGLMFSVIMWLIAFFKRRAAYCPLCKGTPLFNSGALPHSGLAAFPSQSRRDRHALDHGHPAVPLHVLRLGLRSCSRRRPTFAAGWTAITGSEPAVIQEFPRRACRSAMVQATSGTISRQRASSARIIRQTSRPV